MRVKLQAKTESRDLTGWLTSQDPCQFDPLGRFPARGPNAIRLRTFEPSQPDFEGIHFGNIPISHAYNYPMILLVRVRPRTFNIFTSSNLYNHRDSQNGVPGKAKHWMLLLSKTKNQVR
ncbi:hypothetical protein TWF481_010296 [Arthrobotrys musiformis]|uniref:Uncharacterized protein n=1 Tax=Arthrobotrys musiformis TaxID=47236 RepID=A0AAV9W1R4_9PEZI